MTDVVPKQVLNITRAGTTTVRSHLLLCILSGVMLALAYPKPGWGWLAHIALVPATVLALRSTQLWRLAWTSYVVAYLWWLILLRWLWPVTSGGLFALCAYLALYWPAAWLILGLLARQFRLAMVLILPMVWVSLEFLRSYLLVGGFGWFSLSHTQAPYLPTHGTTLLIQVADLFGEHGVSILVAMTNGLLVDLLTRPWVSVSLSGMRRMSSTIILVVAVWAITFLFSWAYGLWRVGQTPQITSGIAHIAVVQTNVFTSNKEARSNEQKIQDWRQLIDLSDKAARSGLAGSKPNIIVWPESAVPVGLNQSTMDSVQHFESSELVQLRKQTAELARTHKVNLLVGAPAYMDWTDLRPQRRYNSCYLVRSDGSIDDQRYDKVHLVPFGEFIPWVDSWPWLKKLFIRYLSPYGFDYTLNRGLGDAVFKIDDVHVTTPICFEDTVPRRCRRMIYGDDSNNSNIGKRADVLINLTNDGWFAGTSQGFQHLQAAVFRCIENRVPMARSVNTGISGYIDSVGRVGPLVELAGRTQQVEGIAVELVKLDPRKTWFGRVGHIPLVAVAVLTAMMVLAALGSVVVRLKRR